MDKWNIYPLTKLIPRKLYIHLRYFLKFKKILDVENPKRFSEKINAMDYKGITRKYSDLADKYKVRKYVKNKVGEKYLTNLINVYESPEEIDFKDLPKKFVLRMNHGCEMNVICDDKRKLNFEKTRKLLEKWMKINYYDIGKEIVYKNIEPKILCEEYLEDSKGNLYDYKFFCFNGEPKYIQVDIGRHTGNRKKCFYDTNWEKQEFTLIYPKYKGEIEKPEKFEEMKQVAKKLSEDSKFVRVDLYDVDGKIYFGELTFTPSSGLGKFYPDKYDYKLGRLFPWNQ